MKCLKIKFAFFLISLLAASLSFADTTHIVQKGDTLFSLSRKYGVTVDSICATNKITRETQINIGQKLLIPSNASSETLAVKSGEEKKAQSADGKSESNAKAAPKAEKESIPSKPAKDSSSKEPSSGSQELQTKIYVVEKGDTWYGISRTNGISVMQLWALNNVDSTAELKFGQKIKIPVESGKVSAIPSNASSSGEKKAASKPDSSNSSSSKAVAKTDSKASAKDSESEKASAQTAKLNDPRNYSKNGDVNLLWPVKAQKVTYINGKVGGVQISCKKDEKVAAISSGTVMFSGSYRGFGNVIFIQSKTQHIYAYTGLGEISVSKGAYITQGTKIGTAGIDTYSNQSSVSLMVFQNGLPIDPAKAPR